MLAVLTERARPEDASLIKTIAGRCPTSLEAILQTYWASYEDSDVAAVLDRDLKLARYLSVRADFAEGVRSVLVDKDNKAGMAAFGPRASQCRLDRRGARRSVVRAPLGRRLPLRASVKGIMRAFSTIKANQFLLFSPQVRSS